METNVDRFDKVKIDGIESTMAEAHSNPDEQRRPWENTVTSTPPLTSNVYCLTSTLSVVVTSAMNGLVVSCSNYSPSSGTTTPVGNAAISVVAAPSVPTITSLISTYSDRLTVTWTSVPTATSYNVSINDSVNTLVPIPSTGAPQYTFTGLTNNTVYSVSVVAINCAGSSSPATITGRTGNGPAAPPLLPSTTTPTPSTTTCPSILAVDTCTATVGIAVGVSVSVTFVVSFSMGVLVASVLCYISRRSKETSQFHLLILLLYMMRHSSLVGVVVANGSGDIASWKAVECKATCAT
ncbi:hypothetical protein EMCRGX_G015606 [Ephydatia muelleri]